MIIDKIHNCDKGWWGLRKFVKIVFPVFRKVELSWTEILLKYWRSFVNKVVLSYIFCFWSVGAWIKVENRLFQPQIKLRLSMTVGNLVKTIYFSLVVLNSTLTFELIFWSCLEGVRSNVKAKHCIFFESLKNLLET